VHVANIHKVNQVVQLAQFQFGTVIDVRRGIVAKKHRRNAPNRTKIKNTL